MVNILEVTYFISEKYLQRLMMKRNLARNSLMNYWRKK